MDSWSLFDQVLAGVLAGVGAAGASVLVYEGATRESRRFGWWWIGVAGSVGVLRLWLASGWSPLELTGLSLAAVAAVGVLVAVAAGAAAREEVWTEVCRWWRARSRRPAPADDHRSSSTRSHPPP